MKPQPLANASHATAQAKPDIGAIPPIESVKLMRTEEVLVLTGICRSTLYNMRKKGAFVEPVVFNERSIRFPESEIRAWIAERVRQRDAKEGGHARP